jgi:hypothetical protein
MNHRVVKKLLCLVLLLPSVALANQYEWATVEVLIFSRANVSHYVPESLPSPYAQMTSLIALAPPLPEFNQTPLPPYLFLPKAKLSLKTVAKRLAKTADNTLVAHVAWHQPIPKNTFGKTIHFVAGTRYQDNGLPIIEDDANTDGSSLSQLQKQVWQISANLQLVKLADDYNVRAYVRLKTPLLDDSQQPIGIKTLTLKQEEHVKVRTLTYFDHPAFGMVVYIKPYQPPIER